MKNIALKSLLLEADPVYVSPTTFMKTYKAGKIKKNEYYGFVKDRQYSATTSYGPGNSRQLASKYFGNYVGYAGKKREDGLRRSFDKILTGTELYNYFVKKNIK